MPEKEDYVKVAGCVEKYAFFFRIRRRPLRKKNVIYGENHPKGLNKTIKTPASKNKPNYLGEIQAAPLAKMCGASKTVVRHGKPHQVLHISLYATPNSEQICCMCAYIPPIPGPDTKHLIYIYLVPGLFY